VLSVLSSCLSASFSIVLISQTAKDREDLRHSVQRLAHQVLDDSRSKQASSHVAGEPALEARSASVSYPSPPPYRPTQTSSTQTPESGLRDDTTVPGEESGTDEKRRTEQLNVPWPTVRTPAPEEADGAVHAHLDSTLQLSSPLIHGRGVSPPPIVQHQRDDAGGRTEDQTYVHARHLDKSVEAPRDNAGSWVVLSSESPNWKDSPFAVQGWSEEQDEKYKIRPWQGGDTAEEPLSDSVGQRYLGGNNSFGRVLSDMHGLPARDESLDQVEGSLTLSQFGLREREGEWRGGGGLAGSVHGEKFNPGASYSSAAAPASRHSGEWAEKYKSAGGRDSFGEGQVQAKHLSTSRQGKRKGRRSPLPCSHFPKRVFHLITFRTYQSVGTPLDQAIQSSRNSKKCAPL